MKYSCKCYTEPLVSSGLGSRRENRKKPAQNNLYFLLMWSCGFIEKGDLNSTRAFNCRRKSLFLSPWPHWGCLTPYQCLNDADLCKWHNFLFHSQFWFVLPFLQDGWGAFFNESRWVSLQKPFNSVLLFVVLFTRPQLSPWNTTVQGRPCMGL